MKYASDLSINEHLNDVIATLVMLRKTTPNVVWRVFAYDLRTLADGSDDQYRSIADDKEIRHRIPAG